jgi:hypothetical protein
MAQKKKGGLAMLHRHYDKVVAVVILIGLLVSLLYLSQSARRVQEDGELFDQGLSALRPLHPEAKAVDPAPYEKAQALLNTPFQMQDATNRPFLVAQERVWCVECRRPILFAAETCPFCNKPQPGPGDGNLWDSDKDGIPDLDERKYGLNPLDPSDVHGDLDNDGFTNLEEHQAGTGLQDPKSHPPRAAFLRVKAIAALPFPLVLRGATRSGDGKFRFQINDTVSGQSFFNVAEGQAIGKTGYTLTQATIKKVTRKVAGHPEPREVDVHVVTLQREGGRPVTLEQDEHTAGDYVVTLVCAKDRAPTDYTARPGEPFTFDGEAYEVMKIDTARQTVVIRRVSDKVEIAVPKN